ncbi:MAG: hypothetical protein L0G23_09505 [Ruaniaceae bacterium]|nr:hypothetical protein [Ruaniaceae bacterium]
MKRLVAWLGAVPLAGLLIACAPTAEVSESPTPEPTVVSTDAATESASDPDPQPTTDPESTAGIEDEVLDVYFRFWAAAVEAQRGNPDPALFEGLAVPELVEEEMREARNYQEWGVTREGEPGFSDTTVIVDGERAVVSSCVDYTTWVIPEAENEDVVPARSSLEMMMIDGEWLATQFLAVDGDPRC